MIKKIKITDTKLNCISVDEVYEILCEFDDHFEIIDDNGDVHTINKVDDYCVKFKYVHEEEECTKPSGFSKKDLVAGKHIVKLADGSVGLVVYLGDELRVLFEDDDSMTLSDQEEDLSYSEDSNLNIVEVYEIRSRFISRIFDLAYHELVWQKNPKRKMTIEEIEEALGYNIEIVDIAD